MFSSKNSTAGFLASIAVFGLLLLPLVTGAQFSQAPIVPCDGVDCNFNNLLQLVNNVIDFLIQIIAVPIATILFLYAGFIYVTAAGDPGKIKKAHGIFVNVFWGFIIALGAWLIIDLLVTTFLKPGYGTLTPTS